MKKLRGKPMAAKTIVLFNHKGGVSKTTSTYNIAWKLTDLGKKVLVVDGDPQCNLTSLILDDNFYEYYEAPNTCKHNIKDALQAPFEGKPRPIESVDCICPARNNKLFLLPGHPNLSEYDPALSLAMNSNNAITTLQNLPGAFEELNRLCAEKYEVDYIFIDMNPGLSAINQAYLMSADGFIIPTNPDPFSMMALTTLKKLLPRWKRWAETSRSLFVDASYPLPSKDMKFIGHIIQRFNLRKGRAATSYQDRIDEINSVVEDQLVPEFNKYDMTFDLSGITTSEGMIGHCLAQISEFGALLQRSHEHSVPVFTLTDEELGRGSGPIFDQEFRR